MGLDPVFFQTERGDTSSKPAPVSIFSVMHGMSCDYRGGLGRDESLVCPGSAGAAMDDRILPGVAVWKFRGRATHPWLWTGFVTAGDWH